MPDSYWIIQAFLLHKVLAIIQQHISVALLLRRKVNLCPTIEEMKDCEKGKAFWSEDSIHDNGACVACPTNAKSCSNESINDKKRCLDSCFAKQTTTKVPTAAKVATATKITSKMTSISTRPDAVTSSFSSSGLKSSSKVVKRIPTSAYYSLTTNRPSDLRKGSPKPVVYPSAHPVDSRGNQELSPKTHSHDINVGHVIAATVGCTFFVVLLVVLIILLALQFRKRKARKRRAVKGDAEEGTALQMLPRGESEEHLPLSYADEHLDPNDSEQQETSQETQPPISQASPSEIPIGGIQDTEGFTKSCLLVTEIVN